MFELLIGFFYTPSYTNNNCQSYQRQFLSCPIPIHVEIELVLKVCSMCVLQVLILMSELIKLLSEVDVFVNIRELNFRGEYGSKLTSMSENNDDRPRH